VAAQSAKADLSAKVIGAKPTQLSLRLKNTSGRTCQVVTTALGTVAVTRVVQHGKAVQPVPVNSATNEDVGYLLQDQLKTLQPGKSVDISLPVYKLSSGYILRAMTWSSDAGAFSTEYLINNTDPLQLDLNYGLPITPTSGAPACDTVFASTTGPSSIWRMLLIIGAAVLLATAIVVLVLWFLRKRHHRKAIVAAVAILLGLGVYWHHAPLVHADVVAPPELQATYDECIGVFNANRDITGPVLDILNNPANHFEIVHTYDPGSDMTGVRNAGGGGDFRIYWNPDDHHRYAGTGGYPNACTVLFHELYHALDMLRGTFNRDICSGSGIETKEVVATRAENSLRVRLGLSPRSHYGSHPLPIGDCDGRITRASCTSDHCAEMNGDPHLYTFDSLRYDFQAAGEFIATQDKSGNYEIQVRQQPWADSRLVSVNTALAFKIDGDKVEIRAGQAMTLLINGKQQPLASKTLPGGGQLDLTSGVITLTWKDGSIAHVQPVGGFGLALEVQLSDALAGNIEGLLGDANGDPKNDLHARASNTAIEPTYEKLYPSFADSWRITDKTSLFTYDSGKDTATYTLRNFPDKPTNPKNLPGYAAAETVCESYGVSDPAILANCALDMAITGRAEFARAAAGTQHFTTGANIGGTNWQLNIKNPGDSASVTFDGKAGEKIFVQVPQTTLPSQCDALSLIGPDSAQLANGCLINGTGYIDGTVLPTTGQYTIRLAPGGPTGTATFRLLRITDKQGSIAPDGATVTAHIDQPGVIARYTFTAQAGQRAYVAIPSSTLDSQCGGVRLLGSDGSAVSNGCIINHVGYIDTVVLPTTGQYTIELDPSDTTTGTANVQLIYPTAENKPITLDGPTLSTNLKKPGSIATFTFNANAGQKVFVDLPSSELPSQCGLLVLHAPDGSALASGCVINHKGNLTDDGVVLPATGQYTLTLDPGAADTGTTTIRLRS
jgi:hypothetical protein